MDWQIGAFAMRIPCMRAPGLALCAALSVPACAVSPSLPLLYPRESVSPGSWMDKGASGGDLLYVSSSVLGSVYVFSYPQRKLVGALTGFNSPFGECVDSAGDVFIVAYARSSSRSSVIYEYAHGGTAPINTLSDPNVAFGCAVNPKTGDLAASGAGVAVYKRASGDPKIYYTSEFGFYFCGYDNKGNLYLSAENGQTGEQSQLVRLARGGSSFEQISLGTTIYTASLIWPSVQWDGKEMTISSAYPEGGHGPLSVYQLRISGSTASVIGTTALRTRRNRYSGQLWIQGKTIIGAGKITSGYENTLFWMYPGGGKPYEQVRKVGERGGPWLMGVAVSPASSR